MRSQSYNNMGMFESDGKAIMVIFIGAIIALTLLVPISNQIVNSTQTVSLVNHTITRPSVNTTTDTPGRTLVGTAVVSNNTGTLVSGAIVSTGLSPTTGLQTIQIFLNDTAFAEASATINITYVYQPDGYVSDSGGRGITTLILIMASLAIVIFTIVTVMDKGSLSKLIERFK